MKEEVLVSLGVLSHIHRFQLRDMNPELRGSDNSIKSLSYTIFILEIFIKFLSTRA